jgi:hypothetical protein
MKKEAKQPGLMPRYRPVPISIFEGAKIVRVIENGDRDCLIYEVSYPIPDGGSDFPQRKLVFFSCSRYSVDEPRGAGEPTIQRIEVIETDPDRMTIRVHTDHGVREVTFRPEVMEEFYESTAWLLPQRIRR